MTHGGQNSGGKGYGKRNAKRGPHWIAETRDYQKRQRNQENSGDHCNNGKSNNNKKGHGKTGSKGWGKSGKNSNWGR